MSVSRYIPKPQFLTSAGDLANGYKVFYYAAGTQTKVDTFTTITGDVANANPIILNARGENPNGGIYLTIGTGYDVVYALSTDTDPPASPIWTDSGVVGQQAGVLPTQVQKSTVASLNTNASCAVYDNCLFVCEFDNHSLACYSIGPDRYTLTLTQRLALAATANPRGISIRDGVAYVTNMTTDTIQVIDVTNKTGLTSISTTATAVGPKDLCINGNDIYVFCNSGFVQKWTIDGKYTITKRYSVATSTTPLGGAVINDVLCVVGQNGKMEVFSLSTLASLSAPTIDTWLSYIEGRGTIGYAVDYQTSKLYKLDLKNPSAPSVLASVSTSTNPSTIKINGDYAYIPCLSSPGKMDVFDLKTFTKTTTFTTNTGQPGYLALNDEHVFISGHASPLTVDSVYTGVEYKRDDYDQRMIDRSTGNFARFNTPFKNVITKTAPYTVAIGDEYIRVGLGQTITLPTASIVYAGMLVTVANVHATLSSAIAGGVVAWTIPPRSGATFICADDGSQWDLASGKFVSYCRVGISGAVALADNATAAIDWNLEGAASWDSEGWHSTTVNPSRITVPAAGGYLVTSVLEFTANVAGTFGVRILRNGADEWGRSFTSPTAPTAGSTYTQQTVAVSDIVVCSAGDYIEIFAFQKSGASRNIAIFSNFTVTRVS